MPTLREIFSNTADAIRAKTGKADTMHPDEMPVEIGSINTASSITSIREGLTTITKINVEVYEEE